MRIVVALGGNALLRRGEPPEAHLQLEHVAEATRPLAELAGKHTLVLTHGNGPQVGLLAIESESYEEVKPYPLDVLGAESQGMIGYLLQGALSDRLPNREVATVVTRVLVDANDPAFARPTKPIGRVYDEATAASLAAEHGWRVAADGKWWRRVVASPKPQRIVELDVIRLLVDNDVLVIAAGGGGIPVVQRGMELTGVEAVIDKDLTASLLARELNADMLLILTDVAGVAEGWGTPDQRFIDRISTAEARSLDLPSGSMGPKVEACIAFVEAAGARAAIGSIEDPAAVVEGCAGTHVVTSGSMMMPVPVATRADRLEDSVRPHL